MPAKSLKIFLKIFPKRETRKVKTTTILLRSAVSENRPTETTAIITGFRRVLRFLHHGAIRKTAKV